MGYFTKFCKTLVFYITCGYLCSMTFNFFLHFSGQMLFSGMDVSKEMTVKTYATLYVHLCCPGNHKAEKKYCVLSSTLLMHDIKLYTVCTRK